MEEQQPKKLNLRDLRIRARLNQAQLGKLAGVDARTIGNAERQLRYPTEITAWNIVDALKKHFQEHPDFVDGSFVVPQTPEDIIGLEEYNPQKHRKDLAERNAQLENQ